MKPLCRESQVSGLLISEQCQGGSLCLPVRKSQGRRCFVDGVQLVDFSFFPFLSTVQSWREHCSVVQSVSGGEHSKVSVLVHS